MTFFGGITSTGGGVTGSGTVCTVGIIGLVSDFGGRGETATSVNSAYLAFYSMLTGESEPEKL
jgi:hypothetical protein